MAITYNRFNDFAAMADYAIEWLSVGYKAEAGIYFEDSVWRPEITLYNERNDMIKLRWNAFAEEAGIDFYGKRAKVEAREMAERFIERL